MQRDRMLNTQSVSSKVSVEWSTACFPHKCFSSSLSSFVGFVKISCYCVSLLDQMPSNLLAKILVGDKLGDLSSYFLHQYFDSPFYVHTKLLKSQLLFRNWRQNNSEISERRQSEEVLGSRRFHLKSDAISLDSFHKPLALDTRVSQMALIFVSVDM